MRLALTVAAECAERRLLVLDRLPIIGDAAFRRWFAGRIAELRRGGTAVIQVVCEPGQLLAPADRMLWIGEETCMPAVTATLPPRAGVTPGRG
jgi:ABC-type siderophore export system fused ATPase/permease subunit